MMLDPYPIAVYLSRELNNAAKKCYEDNPFFHPSKVLYLA